MELCGDKKAVVSSMLSSPYLISKTKGELLVTSRLPTESPRPRGRGDRLNIIKNLFSFEFPMCFIASAAYVTRACNAR